MPLDFSSLRIPVVQAPMAGGPATPALAAAVSEAGGLGFLAGGYLSADALRAEIAEVRELTTRRFGVNLFLPEMRASKRRAVLSYGLALSRVAREIAETIGRPVRVPRPPAGTEDDLDAKVALLIDDPVPVVTFTFGLPSAVHLAALRAAGTRTGVTVTSVAEALRAAECKPDFLVCQGIEAGGHRAQFDQSAAPVGATTDELVIQVRVLTDLPIVAAGGISSSARAQQLLHMGAEAVQIGTLFLTAHEAGTRDAHRRALLGADDTADTIVTRSHSGRPARALANRWTELMDADAVAGYPEVNAMCAALRAAAGDDPAFLNLYAGTGFSACREAPAADVLGDFAGISAKLPIRMRGPRRGTPPRRRTVDSLGPPDI